MVVAEPTLDGASIEVTSSDGALSLSTTRVRGETREDVTINVRPCAVYRARSRAETRTLAGEVTIPREALAVSNQVRLARGEAFRESAQWNAMAASMPSHTSARRRVGRPNATSAATITGAEAKGAKVIDEATFATLCAGESAGV